MFLFISLLFVSLVVADTSGEINHHINITKFDSVLQNSDLSVTCKNCTVAGDFSLSGGCTTLCFPDKTPDANFSSLPFDYSDAWVGVVVEDLSVHFDLDFQLTPNEPTNEITIPLIGDSGLSLDFEFEHIGGVKWMFNPIIHGWVNSSNPVNFTYGFDVAIPPQSAIWIPVVHPGNITTIGFNQSTLTPLTYSSSEPNADFVFEIAFRPQFSVAGSVFSYDFAETTIYTDVPKLDVAVLQVMNVTQDCKAADTDTPKDKVFYNLTNVVPTISFDWGWNATALGDHEYLGGNPTILPTSCLDYLPKSSGLGPAPNSPNKSGANILRGSVRAKCGWSLVMMWSAAWLML